VTVQRRQSVGFSDVAYAHIVGVPDSVPEPAIPLGEPGPTDEAVTNTTLAKLMGREVDHGETDAATTVALVNADRAQFSHVRAKDWLPGMPVPLCGRMDVRDTDNPSVVA